jgi:hypothetical protein
MKLIQTAFSTKDIKEFLEIFEAGEDNIRFKILHINGMTIPAEKDMTLNINQIDYEARLELFKEIKKRNLKINVDKYIKKEIQNEYYYK